MATRTQKAAMKKTADAAKTQRKGKEPPAAKASKGSKAAKGPKKSPATSPTPALAWEPVPDPKTEPKPSLSERFWHRVGLRAHAKEERAHAKEAQAHEHALAHEADLQRKIDADEAARQAAEAEAREARKVHEAADRKAAQKSARELARIAREEDARLKRESEEAAARAVEQAAEERRAAGEARRAAAKEAKLQEAADAERAAEEKAARRREAAAARREAAAARREEAAAAKVQAEADAKLAAEDKAVQRREAAKARREEAAQAKRDTAALAATKAEERRLAREAKAQEKAREEELAQLEAEATARRNAPKVDVTLIDKEDAEEEPEDETPEPAPAARPSKTPAPAADAVDEQADRVAEELRSRRSKPITIDADDTPAPMLPVGRKSREEEPKQVLQLDPAPPARIPEMAAPRGLSIPEHFLLLALEDGWDERREKADAGSLGGALVGSLLLELVLHGKLHVQRDRLQVTDAAVDDAAGAIALKLRQWQDRPSLQAMGELAKWLPQLLPAYKDRMAARGLIEHRAWRHLGMFYRSQTALLDVDAQERMRNKLARAIAGGGRPDAPTILSLGLLEACGLFGVVVPEGAQAYNRKRLNGLLAGKDVMGYKVDDELKGMQEIAVRTILDNVRLMTVRG
ncbi:MAG: GPP34 family phosphoprotein [Candidatus Thermoplasmatota archaeon]